jgi:hypothetical protein
MDPTASFWTTSDGKIWKNLSNEDLMGNTNEMLAFNERERDMMTLIKSANDTLSVLKISYKPLIFPAETAQEFKGATEMAKQFVRYETMFKWLQNMKPAIQEEVNKSEKLARFLNKEKELVDRIKNAYGKVKDAIGTNSRHIPVMRFPNDGVKPNHLDEYQWQEIKEQTIIAYEKECDQLIIEARDPNSSFFKNVITEKNNNPLNFSMPAVYGISSGISLVFALGIFAYFLSKK